MKKIFKLALGLCGLGAAAISVAPAAHATTWGPTVYSNSSSLWSDVAVQAQIWTGGTVTRLITYAASNNQHRGGVYINCTGRQQVGFPAWGVTWYGNGTRVEYYCPNGVKLNNAYGWVDDNQYQ